MTSTIFRPELRKISNWQINTVVHGRGPLILLLHGLALSWEWWTHTIESLSDEFTVCAIDLPGSGDSSPLDTFPPDFAHELVGSVINAIGARDALVVGHSLGGYVAARAAVTHTPGIRAVLLVDAGGFGSVEHLAMRIVTIPFVGPIISTFTPRLLERICKSFVYDPQSITTEVLRWARHSMASPRHTNQMVYQLELASQVGKRADLPLITEPLEYSLPTKVVWGRHDPVFPLAVGRQAAVVLGSSDLTVFEQSGHWPQIEEPERFNKLLRQFARDVFAM